MDVWTASQSGTDDTASTSTMNYDTVGEAYKYVTDRIKNGLSVTADDLKAANLTKDDYETLKAANAPTYTPPAYSEKQFNNAVKDEDWDGALEILQQWGESGLSADDYETYAENIPWYSRIQYELNDYVSRGASKSEISKMLLAAKNDRLITKKEYDDLYDIYVGGQGGRGHTY